jgi:hypothetical protein
MLESLSAVVGTLATMAGLVVLVGVLSHALAWVLTRRSTARWVWNYWNGLGGAILLGGLGTLGYAWIVFGLHTKVGSLLAGVGLLLLSAGLWMLIPV